MERCETLLLNQSLSKPLKKPLNNLQVSTFTEADISRIIEMAWEDRTAFEAIEAQFGINQDGVIKVMRANLKLSSFKLWRERTHGQKTKHIKLRVDEVNRHQSKQHNKLHR